MPPFEAIRSSSQISRGELNVNPCGRFSDFAMS